MSGPITSVIDQPAARRHSNPHAPAAPPFAAPWRGGSPPSSKQPRPCSTRQASAHFVPRRDAAPSLPDSSPHSSSSDSSLLLRFRSISRRRNPSASPPPPPTSPRCTPQRLAPPMTSSTFRPRAGPRRPARRLPSASVSQRSAPPCLHQGPAAPRPRLRCSRCRIRPVVSQRWGWCPR